MYLFFFSCFFLDFLDLFFSSSFRGLVSNMFFFNLLLVFQYLAFFQQDVKKYIEKRMKQIQIINISYWFH